MIESGTYDVGQPVVSRLPTMSNPTKYSLELMIAIIKMLIHERKNAFPF